MDPLSLTASVVAITTVAAQVVKIISGLHQDWDSVPGRVYALHNEIQDFTLVLNLVGIAVRERRLADDHGHSTLPAVLARGELTLRDIRAVLKKIASGLALRKRDAIPRMLMWRKEQGRIAALQDVIEQVKSSLNVILGASISQDMVHVRLQIEELSLKVSDAALDGDRAVVPIGFIEALFREQSNAIAQALNQKFSQIDIRLDRVEALLHAQSAAMHASRGQQMTHSASVMRTSQVQIIDPLRSVSEPPARQTTFRQISPDSATRIRRYSTSVRVRLRQAHATCQAGCACFCHVERSTRSPSFLDRILGQIFIGYSGLSLLSNKCNSDQCARQQIPTANIEYWFPLGFCWSQIVRFYLAYDAHTGPSLQISTLRQVSDSSPCVSFALSGNIDGLKSLFQSGLASPRDVSTTKGYSLLRWALYGQQYETCKFLMIAGADPTYRPIAKSDDCPTDKAGDAILRGSLTQDAIDVLRVIAEGSGYNERQSFCELHKIVLGLCSGDLEESIRKNPDDVDCTDATGRTPLQWAAARGHERAVSTLLSWGADPNHMDNKLNTPLILAANQNKATCVRLLLEAGALPDPKLAPGIKLCTPLTCAARNASDPMVMKALLDFNADIEATGVDGTTPLLHVARGKSAAHAMLLLEHGANINVSSKSKQTPLTAAIQYNNHTVLRLLLERWSDYQQCSRLHNPQLLEIVAHYSDVETMQLLTAADHLRTRTDEIFVKDNYLSILDSRNDNSEELAAAFEDFMSALKTDAAAEGDLVSQMAAGLSQTLSDQDTESDSAFEDAKESL